MRSLNARVTLATMLATVLVLAPGGIAVVRWVAGMELDAIDRRLEFGHERAIENAFQLSVHGSTPGIYTGTDSQGRSNGYGRIYAERTGELFQQGDGPAAMRRAPEGFSFQEVDGERWRIYMATSSVGTGGDLGTPDIQVALPTAELDAAVARATRIVIVVGLLATLLAGLLSRWLASVALAPLARMRRLAQTADLSVRLPVEAPREVAELSGSLNRLLDRLEQSVAQSESALQATRTFTADAGHELRTPLTSLRANLDVLSREGLSHADREKSVRDALAAHTRLTALIDALQVLARGDAAVAHRPEPIDLAELADAVVIEARRRHPDVRFELAGATGAELDADPDGLRMLLENLVENAARHGASSVRVFIKTGPGYARVSVDDDGPGIPDEEKQRVFDRFARGSSARNGTGSGLGLAIAAQQAELHGGRLQLVNSPLGGASFELTLGTPSSS